MFRELTDELLDLRARTLGRAAGVYALTFDCCSCSCTTCWPQPFCIWGGG
jgi:hypothetical protein